eukprot:TRINITY_DN8994_c0_g1_i1.p1 TRINITY_DN8994_c0_g1~~TRINITY_DN8994_c0_g1_i1.p1  ORF type:complete len:102 (-),score=14.14 TRINITY_DN8994_c0_g1_i1:6-311(-)
MGCSNNNAWIFYTICSQNDRQKKIHVTIDVCKTGKAAHEWHIEMIEVDYNDGTKTRIPLTWKPFNAIYTFEMLVKNSLLSKMRQTEREDAEDSTSGKEAFD